MTQAGQSEFDEILQKSIQEIKATNMPLFLAKALCYNIVNLLDTRLQNTGFDSNASIAEFPDIFHLSAYETIDDLAYALREYYYTLHGGAGEPGDKNERPTIEVYKEYIDAHFTEIDFSINSIASFYDISHSNLSHYFKSKTNETILDYLRRKRIEKSIEILQSGDPDPLNIIAYRVGYDNPARFIRNFKFITGDTPGAYRDKFLKIRSKMK